MAITFNAGFAPAEFESSPVYKKVKLLASAGPEDYLNTISKEYGTHQITLKGYQGFYPLPFGVTQLTGDIEIWECECIRETDYTTIGQISNRAFAK